MNSSPEINELCAALSLAQAKFRPAVKNKTNPHFRSTYADLDSVMEAVREHLASNGLSLIQGVSSTPDRLVRITTRLMHKSGQWIESDLDLRPDKDAIQQIGSAITYGRRYAVSAILGVTADEDDDGNGAQSQQTARPAVSPELQARAAAAHAQKTEELKQMVARKQAFAAKCEELGIQESAWPEIIKRLKDSRRGMDDIQTVLTEMEHAAASNDEPK